MLAEPVAYEARYQWTPFIGWAIAGDVAFVLIGALLPMPLVIRADQTGITLGGGPFRYGSTTYFFPWADIRQIVLWQRQIPCTIWR